MWEQYRQSIATAQRDDTNKARSILREFCDDVRAAYGHNGESIENITFRLSQEWPDLAITYAKAKIYLESR